MMGDPVSGTLTHVILAHTVTHLPNFILQRLYRPPRLVAGIHFTSPPPQSITIDQESAKLKIYWPVTSFLPFDVTVSHIEFDLKLNRTSPFFQIQYSRKMLIKRLTETRLEFPVYTLTKDHIGKLYCAQPKTLWMSGCADLDAKFSTFTISFADQQTEPLVVNDPLDAMSIAEYRKKRESGEIT